MRPLAEARSSSFATIVRLHSPVAVGEPWPPAPNVVLRQALDRCTACAQRIVSAPASNSPRWRPVRPVPARPWRQRSPRSAPASRPGAGSGDRCDRPRDGAASPRTPGAPRRRRRGSRWARPGGWRSRTSSRPPRRRGPRRWPARPVPRCARRPTWFPSFPLTRVTEKGTGVDGEKQFTSSRLRMGYDAMSVGAARNASPVADRDLAEAPSHSYDHIPTGPGKGRFENVHHFRAGRAAPGQTAPGHASPEGPLTGSPSPGKARVAAKDVSESETAAAAAAIGAPAAPSAATDRRVRREASARGRSGQTVPCRPEATNRTPAATAGIAAGSEPSTAVRTPRTTSPGRMRSRP